MNYHERLDQIIDGIDKTQTEQENGWWEVSTGVVFGSMVKQQLHSLLDEILPLSEDGSA